MKAPAGYETLSEVAPNLFVGARPPDGGMLNRHGFRVVALCAEEYQPPLTDFRGQVLRVPMLDDERAEPPHIALRKACAASRIVAMALARHERCLCSCNWGFNRSALVAGLALVRLGHPPELVVLQIRRKRGADALSNPSYARAVRLGCQV